jgi:hypothetical protein
MLVQVRIGSRRVAASGQLVLGREEREITFELDGVDCVLVLQPVLAGGPFQVRFDRTDATHLRILTQGRFPQGAVTWTFQGLLQVAEGELDLELMVVSETAELNSFRQVAYTVLTRPAGSMDIDDPTRSAPSRPSAAAPVIQVRGP